MKNHFNLKCLEITISEMSMSKCFVYTGLVGLTGCYALNKFFNLKYNTIYYEDPLELQKLHFFSTKSDVASCVSYLGKKKTKGKSIVLYKSGKYSNEFIVSNN